MKTQNKLPEARQQLCRCEEAEDCRRSNQANKGILKGWIATLTKFARNDGKRTAFTLAEVPEARQHGSKQAAFTLAEVLITLGIIGVVAAMTIPTLTRSYQKKVTIVKLKKIYSALSQTTLRARADNGDVESWTADDSEDFALKYIAPYLKVTDICKTNNCFYRIRTLNNHTYDASNGTAAYGVRLTLTDGMILFLRHFNDATYGQYANILVDLNGDKEPNMLGKDIFRITYYINFYAPSFNGKFIAAGETYSRARLVSHCTDCQGCGPNSTGEFCLALIIKDSWEISKDYPW